MMTLYLGDRVKVSTRYAIEDGIQGHTGTVIRIFQELSGWVEVEPDITVNGLPDTWLFRPHELDRIEE